MASFRLIPASGFASTAWTDPARSAGVGDPGAPSRITTRAGVQHARVRCVAGNAVDVLAVGWNSLVAPADSELDGRLYVPSWVEVPNMGLSIALRPTFSRPSPGTSAWIRFTPTVIGHYLLEVRRAREGNVLFHFDAEAP